MKRKVIVSIILTIAMSFCMTFAMANNTVEVNNLEDIKNVIESSGKENLDIYDVLQIYKDLSEDYSNEEIASEIEKNKELLVEKGISENVIDSGTNVLKSVDEKQLNKILSEDINIDEIQKQLEEGKNPSEILNDIEKDMTPTDKLSLGINVIMAFSIVKTIMWVIVVLIIYNIIVRWRIYKKAGKNGWASLIPIYRDVVMYKISDVSPWVLLLLLVPVVGWFALAIINIYTKFTLAEGFKKGIGFGFGLWLLGPIFEAILAFSKKTKYVGFNKK
ncbi:MAG: DUF5684 domain-containing protein [Clostridia bacterium]|jgi:hypothetical protein